MYQNGSRDITASKDRSQSEAGFIKVRKTSPRGQERFDYEHGNDTRIEENLQIGFGVGGSRAGPEAWKKLVGQKPIPARLATLPKSKLRWSALLTSTMVVALCSLVAVPLFFPEKLVAKIMYGDAHRSSGYQVQGAARAAGDSRQLQPPPAPEPEPIAPPPPTHGQAAGTQGAHRSKPKPGCSTKIRMCRKSARRLPRRPV